MKHLFKFSLLLLVLLLPATALAHDFEVDGIYYKINGTEATVTYRGSDYYQYSNWYTGYVTIPATVTYNGTTYSVTAIDNSAFRRCYNLTSVTIPNSVTSIGNSAFSSCNGLTSIDIPNSVTSIGSGAFFGCSGLTSITIPNSVTYISEDAFYDCNGLISIKVDNDNPNYDSRDNCNAIIKTATNSLIFGCMNTDIPNSVTSIGDLAFYDCTGLTSITIPNSVTSIGEQAFRDCYNLTSVTIGNSVTEIGDEAFEGCSSLTSISIPNSVTSIGRGAFYDCSGLTSITIGNSVTSIGDWAFYGCSGLTSITIPNSVTSIGRSAFAVCIGLTSIDIPNSVTSIGNWAFSECFGLTSVTIGNSVTTIGTAFLDCSNLTEIYCWALTPPTIDTYTFDFSESTTLFVPDIALEAYKTADNWNNFINIVGMPYTFEVDGTKYHATTMNTVSVMANNDEGTLYSGDVVIPDSVIYAGQTFAVTGIENNACDGCYELTSITIPNSVETIGEQAFQGCTGLTSVTIGSGLTAIGAKAFNYCNALETVKCLGTVPPVMASTDCFSTAAYNRATLLVPRQFVDAYQDADYWYKFAHIDGWGSAGRGDIDGDGEVSIRDVTGMIDAILTGDYEGVYVESADLNSNGRLDIGDVTTIIDMLLNDIR